MTQPRKETQIQDANSRLEERLAQAEEKLMARATVTSALIDCDLKHQKCSPIDRIIKSNDERASSNGRGTLH